MVTATACSESSSESSSAPSTSADALTAQLDAAVAQGMRDWEIPGAVVAISVPGKADYVKAFGTSDKATGTPMSLDHHVRIASVTKMFTGLAVLQLVDQKRIHLSAPVARYLAGVPSGDTITLQMLGEMRSGLYPYDNDEEWVQTYLTEAPKGRGDFTTQELLAVSFKHPLNFAPGTELEYSNTNTLPLGMVVEKVSGLSLADYFQQHIFTL